MLGGGVRMARTVYVVVYLSLDWDSECGKAEEIYSLIYCIPCKFIYRGETLNLSLFFVCVLNMQELYMYYMYLCMYVEGDR